MTEDAKYAAFVVKMIVGEAELLFHCTLSVRSSE
jgi:hypothetical protein